MTNEQNQVTCEGSHTWEDGTVVHYSGPLLAIPKYPPGPREPGVTLWLKGTIDEGGHCRVWAPLAPKDAAAEILPFRPVGADPYGY